MNRMSESRSEGAGPSHHAGGSLSHREHAKRFITCIDKYLDFILFYF